MSAPHTSAPPAIDGRSFAAAQAFLLSTKLYWTREIFPALKRDYEMRAADADKQPESAADVAALIGDTTLYRSYAWLERHLQRFKYSGRYGLQPYHAQARGALEPSIDPARLPADILELDPEFEQPAYYTSVDIHQHPGGVWSDEIAGFVYERGARTTTPTHGARHQDLHDRLADAIEAGGAPERVLDMGCGFGKSTEPIYERFRDAAVVGVDLAAPCLKLAARRAADHQARNVRFAQRDATATGFEDGTFDVVTSTMLLHEMPPKKIEAAFAEAHRLLKPGGRMVHLDFHHLPDAFARFIHYGHGRRNNEPFMEPFAKMDLESVLAAKGFDTVAVTPFEEADGALDPGHADWRFPWTLIVAERAA
ncbi:MAG: class I SAM-dependent methyltransferase [Alphaproteobacteria bacterium]|nr:class I SAM-dependent methyltransferase [Alphaproteobacteria bacterium]